MEPLKVILKKYLAQAAIAKYTKFKRSHWSVSTVKFRTIFSGCLQTTTRTPGEGTR